MNNIDNDFTRSVMDSLVNNENVNFILTTYKLEPILVHFENYIYTLIFLNLTLMLFNIVIIRLMLYLMYGFRVNIYLPYI